MVNKKALDEAKRITNFLVNNYPFRGDILAIYTMGSFAEGDISKFSDIDLNIFIKKMESRHERMVSLCLNLALDLIL